MWPFTSKKSEDSEHAQLRARSEKVSTWLKGYYEGGREMTPEVREAIANAHRNHVR